MDDGQDLGVVECGRDDLGDAAGRCHTNVQDAVEVVVRDLVEPATRTEAVTGHAPDEQRAETELRQKRDSEAAGGKLRERCRNVKQPSRCSQCR